MSCEYEAQTLKRPIKTPFLGPLPELWYGNLHEVWRYETLPDHVNNSKVGVKFKCLLYGKEGYLLLGTTIMTTG